MPQETHEPDNASIVENLVDTSPVAPELPPKTKTPPPLPHIDFDALLKERDGMIRQLHQEIEKQQHVMRQTAAEKNEYENRVQEHVAKINSELTQTRSNLSNMRKIFISACSCRITNISFSGIEKEELDLKLQSAPSLERKKFKPNFIFTLEDFLFYFIPEKAHDEEERAKSSEEKFQKLKNMYTQIRDEHIKLLRQVRMMI